MSAHGLIPIPIPITCFRKLDRFVAIEAPDSRKLLLIPAIQLVPAHDPRAPLIAGFPFSLRPRRILLLVQINDVAILIDPERSRHFSVRAWERLDPRKSIVNHLILRIPKWNIE
ncbi:hypothetical protein COO09_12215 [Rhizorhabdus dicambivorans]|uniref:Uncharacterized protein n=1 Tax=Rhizorhabdus dicambivorans TaxID=1850238 RepID=A0A2A4FV79_9SPHN|nr:hypothetical protein CMV14_18510 [Rhizorhabdus dicambivorans]PCE42074.1 hypothetical protein COO09_12215 [Rhizorhabdus dicambivorans]